ncbi:FAD-dependent oxidoreductase [Zestomonas thermotolerans]|uniref:FAD-dependent oxidoreductase n=1 Tax=Zestomonas thermotolerans TaxID=157784 RepID=UPI0023F23803|nr:FAD-dependent oxidoreductase [Pseudomonas thermotolerans]
MAERIVIVGAGQAAVACAARLRALSADSLITVIGSETHLPYQRPPLSKAFLALLGTVRVVSTEGLSLASFLDNLASNPLSYGLALTCAVTFALYCNITTRYARGENHVALFFALTALVLWLKYALSEESLPGFAPRPTLELAALVLAMAGGYALWNLAILRGNLTLLAALSYFTPVLAAGFSAFWLSASLTLQFWQGVVLVTLGSLVCWYGTRSNVAPAQALDGRPGDGAGQPVRS